MSSPDLRHQSRSLKNTPACIKVAGQALASKTSKAPVPKIDKARPWFFKGSMVLMAVMLIGLQGLDILWSSQEQAHHQAVAAQMARIQTEVTGLRGLVHTNIAKDLIYLKILVLNPRVPNQTARQIASAIYKSARLYNRDPDLILSIMKVESDFDPTIVSRMGAIGLMQIMPQWIDVLDIRCDLNNPDCNVRYGLQILGAYEQLYGELDMALTAYNRGPGPVDYALMRGKDPDNGYAGKVQAVYNRLRAINRTNHELEVAYSKE